MRRNARSSPLSDRILRTAVELFAEHGFDATTVQQIVDAAEVTKGALYHYFDSKNDLLFEIYHSLIGTQTADLARIAGQDVDAAEKVRAILLNVVETTTARINEAAVFSREVSKLDAARMTEFRADRRRYHETLRDVIATAQETGIFAPVVPADTVVRIAMGAVNQLPTWYRSDGEKTPREIGTELADFVLAALRP
ncbi:MAG: TetR/AcrR family transcriptional regulator [Sciscionella sp.]